MKSILFILLFGLIVKQHTMNDGIPIKIIKSGDTTSEMKSQYINVELDGNTVSITFNANCGAAYINIETVSGSHVESAYCSNTPGYAELTVSSPESYVLFITIEDEVYSGVFYVN